jgi:hypothetical protein
MSFENKITEEIFKQKDFLFRQIEMGKNDSFTVGYATALVDLIRFMKKFKEDDMYIFLENHRKDGVTK